MWVMQATAVGAAVASAATFGLSTSLQHRASHGTLEARSHLLLARLARTPSWWAGIGLSLAAFALHAVALAAGSLTLVQPVVVTGLVFAVLIRAALDRRRPSRAEVGWAVVTWAGLAAFLVGTGHAAAAQHHGAAHAGAAVLVLVALAGATALGARGAHTPTGRGLWLGSVSGILFGLVAVLLKLVVTIAASGVTAVATTWPVWAMAAAGVSAVVVNQRAYQSSRLSVSMPLLNIVDVLVALSFAAVVLGDRPPTTPLALLGQVAGLAAMALGVVRLARLEEVDPAAPGEPDPRRLLLTTGGRR